MRRSLVCVLAGALLLPGLAAANWMRDYDRGIRALRDENWTEAEQHFRAAIAARSEPALRQRFQGQRFEPYLPQHWAAMAALGRGDCEAALGYWQHGALDAVLVQLPERQAERQQGVDRCRSTQRLVQAPAAVEPAAEPPSADTRPAASEPLAARSSTSPPPASTSSPAAAQTATARRSEPARGAAPAALQTAVDAWLAGRYGELAQSDPSAISDDRLRSQLLLLRAAARFVRSELDGDDGNALDNVRADLSAARAANAALTPDAAMFPPRFRALWQEMR
jgi:hypothetical protein